MRKPFLISISSANHSNFCRTPYAVRTFTDFSHAPQVLRLLDLENDNENDDNVNDADNGDGDDDDDNDDDISRREGTTY